MSNQLANKNMPRRKFIGLAGGAVGMAAMSSLGLRTAWARNISTLDVKKMSTEENSTDVLVIGGGMAGLFASVKAHDAGAKVMMVSKGRLGSSGQTPFAKGIFVFDPAKENVSLDDFVEKVSVSAIGTNNPVYTRQMAEHSMARVNELREWGFFDSALYNKSFSKPIKERDIDLIERVTITHLIKEDGKIAGAAGFSIDDQ
ncbi:MAG: FAD-binding protein, partial [Bacteroidales bacterium]|nr:FAD-binding protein [Bacteroidales bacterium]